MKWNLACGSFHKYEEPTSTPLSTRIMGTPKKDYLRMWLLHRLGLKGFTASALEIVLAAGQLKGITVFAFRVCG